ncbi:helix-turn-helix domain-containing protein [Lentibacillus sediminis]|uniref:helix-turn-helix domain-containing protein n=1 Tax=Lentibacillus sediminis TaxID=1940529 RepID=UPI000C1C50A9|nr:helix-turn-helix transcriptional regulator [Lentibacillus sediminis]
MLGTNIKNIREKKGLTLSECAQRAKVSKSYLSNIERNKNRNPSISILERLANVLDVDLRRLIDTDLENSVLSDREWMEFVHELKESGVKKDQVQQVIEFTRWQKEQKQKE